MATARVEENGVLMEEFHYYTLGEWLVRRVWNMLQMMLRVTRRNYKRLKKNQSTLFNSFNK